MKKTYEKPSAVKIEFDFREVCACSMPRHEDDKPGHGWGDKNHDHTHWKDGLYGGN